MAGCDHKLARDWRLKHFAVEDTKKKEREENIMTEEISDYGSCKCLNALSVLCVLDEISWNFIGGIAKHDCCSYIGRICNTRHKN